MTRTEELVKDELNVFEESQLKIRTPRDVVGKLLQDGVKGWDRLRGTTAANEYFELAEMLRATSFVRKRNEFLGLKKQVGKFSGQTPGIFCHWHAHFANLTNCHPSAITPLVGPPANS
ncbi:hypothetical protein K0M31_006367 [Melipona bicolor]|uniref:Uncharacterized protein n=1 Tax=Melipona bicolor TaxID=60889 RepID=A0AA40FTF0_9HYME|nr:hypothetical protein K0M31_006367 [Melipona bicolor]